jgi:phage/plasmid-associated DNA primase
MSMQGFQITPEVIKDPESVAELEGIINSALKLNGSDGHRILNTLLTGYLQQPFDEDDLEEVLDEIDQVAGFCEKLGRLVQSVNVSRLK